MIKGGFLLKYSWSLRNKNTLICQCFLTNHIKSYGENYEIPTISHDIPPGHKKSIYFCYPNHFKWVGGWERVVNVIVSVLTKQNLLYKTVRSLPPCLLFLFHFSCCSKYFWSFLCSGLLLVSRLRLCPRSGLSRLTVLIVRSA